MCAVIGAHFFSTCTVGFYTPHKATEQIFLETAFLRRLNCQLFSPKVILPIFNPIFTFLCAKAPIGKTGKNFSH